MRKHEQNHHRREQVQALLYEIACYLELVAAALVVILIVCQAAGLAIDMFSDINRLTDSANFNSFLALALNIVVGIEFLKMLCRHSMDDVIEVLLFTLARQLIVTHHSMVESLLCIVAIAILFVVRKFLFIPKIDKKKDSLHESSDTPETK